MLDQLREMLRQIEEAITYSEACDHAYTRFYTELCGKRRALRKVIKKFEKIERNTNK